MYGRPRIFAELKENGEGVGEKRVGRLMRQEGIRGVSRRRRGPKATQRNVDARPAADLVERDFAAEGPDQLKPRVPEAAKNVLGKLQARMASPRRR